MEAPPRPSSRLTRRPKRGSAPSAATTSPPPTKRRRLSDPDPDFLASQLERIKSSLEAIDTLPQAAPALRLLPSLRTKRSTSSTSPNTDPPRASASRSRWEQTKSRPGQERQWPAGSKPARPLTGSSQASASSSPLPRIPRRASPLPPIPRSAPRGSTSTPASASGSGSPGGLTSTAAAEAESPSESTRKRQSTRWTSPAYCQSQFDTFRTVAHGLKKRADGLMKQTGGSRGRQLEVAQVMWTDSLLLYAYASWARDQRLRFGHAKSVGSPSSERGEAQEIRLPQPLERSTCQRGVKDWLELQPLLEHVTHQLRKTPTAHTNVLEAVLQTLQARILLLSASYRQGSASRKINMFTQAREAEGSPAPNAEDLISTSAWARENQARAWFNPIALQEHYPHTWSALTTLPSDRKEASEQTLRLDPSSLPPLDSHGFASGSHPVFPLPQGPDALAHLVLMGRMLVAETVQQRGLEYDPVSIPAEH